MNRCRQRGVFVTGGSRPAFLPRRAAVMKPALAPLCGLLALPAWGSEIRLRDGFTIEGSTFPFKAIADGFKAGLTGASPGDPILVIDDVLHLYYVPRLMIDLENVKVGRDDPLEKITIKQPQKREGGAKSRASARRFASPNGTSSAGESIGCRPTRSRSMSSSASP